MLRIKVIDTIYEIDVDGLFLQKMFGTFHKERTPFKMERSNWDNSEFFDHQSKEVFTISVGSQKKTVKTPVPVSDEEKNEMWNRIQKENPMRSSEEIDSLVKTELANGKKSRKQFTLNKYVTVTAYFADGEWHWNTEYTESDIHASYKRENTRETVSYTSNGDEKLGIIENEICESDFDFVPEFEEL